MTEAERNLLRLTISDLVLDFLYYDRKGDEDLPLGVIEQAIENKEITIQEIVKDFESELNRALQEHEDEARDSES